MGLSGHLSGIPGLGARLAAARIQRDMTQLELARKARMAPRAISHFEVGARRPSAANLRRLCIALGCSSDYVLGIGASFTKADAKLLRLP